MCPPMILKAEPPEITGIPPSNFLDRHKVKISIPSINGHRLSNGMRKIMELHMSKYSVMGDVATKLRKVRSSPQRHRGIMNRKGGHDFIRPF